MRPKLTQAEGFILGVGAKRFVFSLPAAYRFWLFLGGNG